MEHCSVIIKNEILPFSTTWMDLEGIMLREVSQTEKDKYCVFTFMWDLKNKTNEQMLKNRNRQQTIGTSEERGRGEAKYKKQIKRHKLLSIKETS